MVLVRLPSRRRTKARLLSVYGCLTGQTSPTPSLCPCAASFSEFPPGTSKNSPVVQRKVGRKDEEITEARLCLSNSDSLCGCNKATGLDPLTSDIERTFYVRVRAHPVRGREAKLLLKSLKEGDEDALARARPYFDQPSKLSEMQLVVAREYGFESWAKLKQHFELRAQVAAARADMSNLEGRMLKTLPQAQFLAGNKVLSCDFCGKSQHEVRKLIAAPSASVCDACVDLLVQIKNGDDMRRWLGE